jgi:uncharacterized protein with von Willebrand factor type A (vWA) domain
MNATKPTLTGEEIMRGDLILARLVDFTRLLWELGFDIGPGRVVELADSLSLINIASRDEFYMLLKVSLVSKHDQQILFDMAFAYFWRSPNSNTLPHLDAQLEAATKRRGLAMPEHRRREDDQHVVRSTMTPDPAQRHPFSRLNDARRPRRKEEDEDIERSETWSADEVLRHKDFEQFTYEELQEARDMMAKMHWRLGERRTRRLRPSRHGRQLDLRQTLRRSLRTDGEPIVLSRRRPRVKPRPLVILCDISGSMSLYSRLLLHFVHTVSNGLSNVETFLFGTRLTRITRQLARRDVDDALTHVARSVQDWSGGTRIGDSLRAFNRQWSRRVLGRGAVVLIISDGWDRGDVKVLAEEMARLYRNSHRLIWLNPLLGHEDYRPVTAGMRAALPYIDAFLPANNLDSLFALGRALESIDESPRSPEPLPSPTADVSFRSGNSANRKV